MTAVHSFLLLYSILFHEYITIYFTVDEDLGYFQFRTMINYASNNILILISRIHMHDCLWGMQGIAELECDGHGNVSSGSPFKERLVAPSVGSVVNKEPSTVCIFQGLPLLCPRFCLSQGGLYAMTDWLRGIKAQSFGPSWGQLWWAIFLPKKPYCWLSHHTRLTLKYDAFCPIVFLPSPFHKFCSQRYFL